MALPFSDRYEYMYDTYHDKYTSKIVSRMQLEDSIVTSNQRAQAGLTGIGSMLGDPAKLLKGSWAEAERLRAEIQQIRNEVETARAIQAVRDQGMDDSIAFMTNGVERYHLRAQNSLTPFERSLQDVEAVRKRLAEVSRIKARDRYVSEWADPRRTEAMVRDAIPPHRVPASVEAARPARGGFRALLLAPFRYACRLCGRKAASDGAGRREEHVRSSNRFSGYFGN